MQVKYEYPHPIPIIFFRIKMIFLGALTETLACPFCSGEMLVQRKSDSSDSDSPVDTADTKMNVEEDDEKSEVTPRKRRKRSNSVSILANEPTDDEETLLPSSYRSPSVFSGETKSPSTADVRGEGDQVYHRHGSSEETLFIVRSVDEALDLLRTQVNSQEKGDIEWNFENCRAIDHRLRLYIDMEILKEPSERFEIMLKVSGRLSKLPRRSWQTTGCLWKSEQT